MQKTCMKNKKIHITFNDMSEKMRRNSEKYATIIMVERKVFDALCRYTIQKVLKEAI